MSDLVVTLDTVKLEPRIPENLSCPTCVVNKMYHVATACMRGVTSPRHSATALNNKL